MFIKNTIKNLLIASLFVSSITISTNTEAARKPQLNTKATIGIYSAAAAVVIVGLTAIACWIGAKSYFAHKLGVERLKLLKKFNHSIPSIEEQQAYINQKYQMPYSDLKKEAQTVYSNHTLPKSEESLKYKFPVAALYTNVKEIGFYRKISRLFSPKCKTLEDELSTEVSKLEQIEEFNTENKTYTKERENKKTKYREESSRWWSEFAADNVEILIISIAKTLGEELHKLIWGTIKTQGKTCF